MSEFKVGDFVVYIDKGGLDDLCQVEALTKTGNPKSVKNKNWGGFPCRFLKVRHATKEEIKAGRRLP